MYKNRKASESPSGGDTKQKSVLGLRISKFAQKARKYLDGAYDIAQAVNDIQGSPRLHNWAALGTLTASKLADHFAFDPHDDQSLVEPVNIPHEFRDFIRQLAQKFPSQFFENDGSKVQISHVHGWDLVFQGRGYDIAFWYQSQGLEDEELKVRHAIGRACWEVIGSRMELLAPSSDSRGRNATAAMHWWDIGDILASDQCRVVLARTKKFLAYTKHRSILFHGIPGTGKSCMVRAIADEMEGTVLFFDSAQIGNMDAGVMTFLMENLCPDVVIIDDLDRVSDPRILLSCIDHIRAKTKLLMVTVNHLDKMDPAVIRAGRFDDHIQVIRVLHPCDILPGRPEAFYDAVANWPAAFLHEMKVRLEVLGEGAFVAEYELLEKRVKANDNDND